MTRNLKVLGLALAAMFAMSAFVANAASAANFHSDSASTIITGTQTGNHVFDAAGNSISCKKASFKGTQGTSTASAIRVTASYSECTFFGVPVAVNMNGCEYEFLATGTVNIVSIPGKNCATEPITFRASFFGLSCDVKIGAQSGLEKATYDGTTTVASPPSDIVVTPAVTGIAYTAEGGGCSETGSLKNGNYTTGPTTVQGFVDNAGTEGAQTPIWVTH